MPIGYKKVFSLAFIAFTCVSITTAAGKKDTPKRAPQASTTVSTQNDLASYPLRFREISNASQNYINQGRYAEAIQEYYRGESNGTSAFTYLKDSYKANASEEDIEALEKILKKLDATLSEYTSLQGKIRNQTHLDVIQNQIADVYNDVYRITEQIAEIRTAPYTQSLLLFIKGAPERKSSGVMGVIKSQWDSFLQNEIQAVAADNSYLTEGLINCLNPKNIFLTENETEGKNCAEKLLDYVSEAGRIYSKNRILISQNTENLSKAVEASQNLLTECIKLFDSAKKLNESSHITASAPEDKLSAFRDTSSDYAETLVKAAEEYTGTGRAAAAAKNSQFVSVLTKYKGVEILNEGILTAFTGACSAVEQKSAGEGVQLWIQAARFYADCSTLSKNEQSAKTDEIKSFLKKDENDQLYPTRALTECSKVLDSIEDDKKLFNFARNNLNRGFVYRSSFVKELGEIDSSDFSLNQTIIEIQSIQKKALSEQIIAQAAAGEVQRFLDISRQKLSEADFTDANNLLGNAQSAYSAQLSSLKHDGDIMTECYNNIQNLRSYAIETERPMIVTEMRALKNRARMEYYAARFEEASAIITSAENIMLNWAALLDSEPESDSELERLKDYVNTAIIIKEGRDFSPYDSKAPEMEQQLSSATILFEQAKALNNAGNKKAAAELFEYATRTLNLVKIFYPRNSRASILQLQIMKIVKPEEYSDIIKDKIAAMYEINFSVRDANAQQAYADLQDILVLEPDYPGLKSMLANAEVALGLRPPKLSDSTRIRSEKLVVEAQQLFSKDSLDEKKLSEAKRKAEEALSLNPNNTDAQNLLDAISKAKVSSGSVQLSAEDEELYQAAVLDMQNNRILAAREKINTLISRGNNASSAKVIKLKKRIEGLL